MSTTYDYDGEGRRVKKTIAGVGTPAVMVYDAMGQAAVEVGGAAGVAAAGPHYLMADGLGSVRLRTDGAGAVDKCYDYLPSGEALVSGRPAAYYSQVTATVAAGIGNGGSLRGRRGIGRRASIIRPGGLLNAPTAEQDEDEEQEP